MFFALYPSSSKMYVNSPLIGRFHCCSLSTPVILLSLGLHSTHGCVARTHHPALQLQSCNAPHAQTSPHRSRAPCRRHGKAGLARGGERERGHMRRIDATVPGGPGPHAAAGALDRREPLRFRASAKCYHTLGTRARHGRDRLRISACIGGMGWRRQQRLWRPSNAGRWLLAGVSVCTLYRRWVG